MIADHTAEMLPRGRNLGHLACFAAVFTGLLLGPIQLGWADDPPPLQDVTVPRKACLSIGTCEDGSLQGGVELSPATPGLMLLRIVRQRGTNWGTQRLVDYLARTAERLQKDPGHAGIPLRVGNLSGEHGGPMRWSHSHRAGRDVDLAFFAIGERSGKPRAPDRYLYFNEEGKARWRRHRYLFDVARNWALVKTLLTDPSVHVARIYIAEPLRRLMLDHGREQGDAEWLLQRAGHVLSEPSHAGKHNDHMHVRIYCSKAEVLAGCVDDAPPWPWVPDHGRARRQRVEELVRQVGSRDREERMAAVRALAPLHSRDQEATDGLVWVAAHDPSPTLRSKALAVLREGGSDYAFPLLTAAARRTRVSWRTYELLRAAVLTASQADAAALHGLLDLPRSPYADRFTVHQASELRRLIAQKVRPWLMEKSAQPMLRALDDPSSTTRRAALRTLEHLANRRFERPADAHAWYQRAAQFGRLHWMYQGFFQAGVPVQAPAHVLGPRLIDMLRGPDEVLAANAEALLTRVTGGVTLRYVPTPPRRHRAWDRWWSLNQERFLWSERRPAPPTRRVTQGDCPES